MEIAVAVVALLAIAIAAVLLIGRSLPVAHVASRTAAFRRSPQEVWSAIADRDFMRRHAGNVDTEVIESRPPRRLVTRIVGETAFGGTWTCDIAPTADGSTLTITEEGEVYNTFFRFVSKYVMGHHRTIDRTIAALRERFGER